MKVLTQSKNILSLQGIFPVYKPIGITSSQVLEVIKTSLRKEAIGETDVLIKMGHGGTLDKSASGVLVVGIGKGCSKLPAFLDGGKVYLTRCVFGRATDTYNKEGKSTLERPYEHITLQSLKSALLAFKGQLLQKPPVYSALKYKGKRLSDLANEGTFIDPEPRLVYCYDFKITDFSPPVSTFELFCGRGFYVRSLVHDLGVALDSCAHVDELERTRQGPFDVHDCLKVEEISIAGVHEKIISYRSLVESYLDNQMAEYRLLQSDKH